MQNGDARHISKDERHSKREQTEHTETTRIALHAFHVHLKRGKKHYIIQSHLAEKLKGVVAGQNVEAILAYSNTCKHHSYDVRNAQFAHYDRGKEDDEQHHKEYESGVGDREIVG